MKIAAGIEYDGSLFHGWQKQTGLQTIQQRLEEAFSKVADHPVQVVSAGRTDTGVHATGQVLHFETKTTRSVKSWVFGANHNLPKTISVSWAKVVPDDFHARFSATARQYHYIIYNHSIRPALLRSHVTWHYRNLDIVPMQKAAQLLIGEHDFTSYRALECQAKSPIREILHFNIYRQGDFVILDIKANAFLHHMVRNIAGVLMAVGNGVKLPEWSKAVLEAKNRSMGGVTAPAYGLYLTEVTYPEHFQIPVPRKSHLLLSLTSPSFVDRRVGLA